MVVECPYCEAHVAITPIAQHEAYDPDEDPAPFTTVLTSCPRCSQTLVAGYYTYDIDDRKVADTPSRLWPVPPRTVSRSIPELVRDSIAEANTCYRAGAFSACAVMCGRALEAVCKHFGSKGMLGQGLRELRDRQIIDGRLSEWATELQKSRNLSAHPSGEKVSKSEAQDLLDFTNAICEYVFVLTQKFNAFQKRKAAAEAKKAAPTVKNRSPAPKTDP
jgi:hypothetical protein